MPGVSAVRVEILTRDSGYPCKITVRYTGPVSPGEIFGMLNGSSNKTGLRPSGCELVCCGFDYPLYCVDRGDSVDPERQYLGPYKTHDEAHEQRDADTDLVRRCRQLRPSEVAFDRDAASLAEYEVFDALVDELDEAANSGNLPEGAWHRIDERVVSAKYNDDTFPTARDYDTWVDDHLSVDAYICEGDE